MATDVKIILSAQDKTAAAFKTATGNIKALQTGAASLVTSLSGLGIGLSVAGIAAFAKSAIDSLDALNDLSDATGASIENISALEDVAARTGTSMDSVSQAIIKMNQALNAATPDSSTARAFEAIGLSVDTLKQQDPVLALQSIAKALANFADDGEKARLVQELFGKSVAKTAPLLNDLAEKGKLVGTVTAEQAAEAEKFNQALAALQKNVNDVARDLAGPLVKSLNEVIAKFAEGRAAGKGFLETGLDNYWKNVREFYGMKQPEIVAPEGSWSTAGAGRGSVNPEFSKPSVGGIPDKPTKTKTGGGAAKDPYAEINRYIEGLQKQINTTKELTTVQQLGFDINAGYYKKLTPELQSLAVAKAIELDTTKAQTEAEKNLTKASAERVKAEQDRLAQLDNEYAALIDRLTANTPTMQFAAQQQDLAALQKAFSQGVITEQLYAEAVAARLDLNNDKIKQGKTLAEDMQYVFTDAFKGMEDSLVNFVQTGKLDFGSLADSIIADMARIAIQQSVTKPLMAGLTSMFGFADGGVFNSPSLSAYSGGVYSSPQLFKFASGAGVFGEAGPEAIMPLTRDPNGKLGVQAIGGGGSMVVNIQPPAGYEAKTEQRSDGNGVDVLDVMFTKIDQKMAAGISQGNSRTAAAMGQTYGLNRVAGAY